jgi:hypothetical protein
MLLTQCFTKLLRGSKSGQLQNLSIDLTSIRIPMVLAQIFSRTLRSQLPSGAWGCESCEVTAYVICTLVAFLESPWAVKLGNDFLDVIYRGRDFLIAHADEWNQGGKLWIEKVSYKITALTEAYCLSALRIPLPKKNTQIQAQHVENPLATLPSFFATLPLFSTQNNAAYKLRVAMMESHPFMKYLRSVQHNVFEEEHVKGLKRKHLVYIPFTWTACGAFRNNMSVVVLRDMMELSMLNYQIDAFMET